MQIKKFILFIGLCILLSSFAYAGYWTDSTLSMSLIEGWHFNGTAFPNQAIGINGKYNSTVFKVNNTNDRNNELNQSIQFYNPYATSAGDSYVTMSSTLTILNQSWSTAFWMKKDEIASDKFVFGYKGDTYNYLEVNTNDFSLAFDSSSASCTSANIVPNDKLWHFYVITVNSNKSCNFYLDGDQYSSSASTNAVAFKLDTLGDGYFALNTYRFVGYLDELTFYNKTLNISDILYLNSTYNTFDEGTATPPTPSVTINLLSPTNMDRDINSSINWTFNATYNDTFSVYINSTLACTAVYTTNYGSTSCYYNLSYDGNYTWYVRNSTGAYSSNNYTYYLDRVTPFIEQINPFSTTYQNNSLLNVSIGADFLYKAQINCTCSNGTNIASLQKTYSGAYQRDYFNITAKNYLCGLRDTVICLVEAADTHTAKKWEAVSSEVKNKEIKIDGIKITPVDKNDVTSIVLINKFDRVSYRITGSSSKKYREYYIDNEIAGELIDIKKGDYSNYGHIVNWLGFGKGSQWIDFKTQQKFKVDLTKTETGYKAKVDCGDFCNDLMFESLGGLNENNLTITYRFDLSNITVQETYTEPLFENQVTILYANITYNPFIYAYANNYSILQWNNTNYSVLGYFNNETNATTYNASVIVPTGYGINGTLIGHRWWINLTNLTGGNFQVYTNITNQTIHEYILDNCTRGITRTKNFTLRDENTLKIVDGYIKITYNYTTDGLNGTTRGLSYNFQNINTTNFCIYPEVEFTVNGIIEYGAAGYQTRYYSIVDEIWNNITSAETLYLADTSNSTNILITVNNEVGLGQEDVQIVINRYNAGTGTYLTVETLNTNYAGQTLAHLQLYNVYYTFTIYKNGQLADVNTYTNPTGNSLIVANTIYFVINTGTNVLETLDTLNDLQITPITQTAATMYYSYSDPTNELNIAELTIYSQPYDNTADWTIYNTTSSTSMTTTLLLPFVENLTDGNRYMIVSKVKYQDNGTVAVMETKYLEHDPKYSIYDMDGLLAALILVLTSAMVGVVVSPVVTIVLVVAILFVCVYLGFVYLSIGSVVSLIILALILSYKMRG